jgi:hypothetical protein
LFPDLFPYIIDRKYSEIVLECGPMRKEAARDWRKLKKDYLHDMQF